MLGVLVDGQPEPGQLGQEHLGQSGVDQQSQAGHRIRAEQQLGELVADAHPVTRARSPAIAVIASTTSGATAKPSSDAKRPPAAFAGGRPRTTARGCPAWQHPRGQVVQPAVRIGELVPGQAHRHRVDREVAPTEVVEEAGAVLDHWVAGHSVIRLGPVRRDLQAESVALGGDRAEVPPGLPDCLGPTPYEGQGLLGPGVGGEVEVVAEPAEQRVADRASDQMEFVSGGDEAPAEVFGDRGHTHEFGDRAALGRAQRAGRGGGRVSHRDESLTVALTPGRVTSRRRALRFVP